MIVWHMNIYYHTNNRYAFTLGELPKARSVKTVRTEKVILRNSFSFLVVRYSKQLSSSSGGGGDVVVVVR